MRSWVYDDRCDEMISYCELQCLVNLLRHASLESHDIAEVRSQQILGSASM